MGGSQRLLSVNPTTVLVVLLLGLWLLGCDKIWNCLSLLFWHQLGSHLLELYNSMMTGWSALEVPIHISNKLGLIINGGL